MKSNDRMKSHDFLKSYHFFFACGTKKAGFQKISGIGSRIEVEYIHEGGQTYAYPLRGKSRTGKLTLEKGMGTGFPFAGLTAGTRINEPCSIIVLDDEGTMRRVFAFDQGLITSWESGELDAQSNTILIDKLEIEHTGLYEIG